MTEPKISTAPASRVPFLDLAASHGPLARDILDDIAALLATGAFTNGPAVGAFEQAFATYCGVAQCVGTASGLDALRFALIGLGVQAGDEVIVPAMTFVATFEAVTQAGATPVPVDVSLSDSCIDVDAMTAAIGERTRAIMPVHLYGRLADMEAIGAVARSHGLIVVEDACQAHGATRSGVRAGTAGDAAAFSFYPGKNLGAFGDAGALVTDDPELAGQTRALREHGQQQKYEHDIVGWTSRLDTIQATVLARKLPHLDAWNDERRRIADMYAEGLAAVGDLALPDVTDRGQVWHLFVVRTADPSGLAAHLDALEIGSGRHYPEPPHRSKAYAHLGAPEGSCPNAEQIAREALSLPIFPGMTESQVERVVAAVRSWFADA